MLNEYLHKGDMKEWKDIINELRTFFLQQKNFLSIEGDLIKLISPIGI